MTKIPLNEWTADHFTIVGIDNQPRIDEFFDVLKVPPTVRKEIYLLTVPPSFFKRFQEEYAIVQEKTTYPLSFSLEDFILAYIGAMHGWGIVSYDRDLLTRIHHYLSFDAFLPNECHQLPADAMVLLDTNILFTYYEGNSEQKHEITSLITENLHLTFLLPQHIISETQHVIRKHEWSSEDEIALYLDPAEGDIVEFVEDFKGFQSDHTTRHKRKKQTRWKKKVYKDRLRGKWGKYVE